MPRRTAFLITLLLAGAARAEMPTDLALPLDCEPGASCWVLRYVDHDPGPGARDQTCGTLAYDGHDGIDIRVPGLVEMRAGVAVLAAAPGTVLDHAFLADRGLLRIADPLLAAQHLNWSILAIPLNEAMFRRADEGFAPADLERWADEGVRVFLAAYAAP